jgi:hypothetical protein
MIPQSFIDYYGDQTRWFLGTVVNIADDPLKLGRARVRIFGVYDEIEEEDLPWAQIVVPVTHTVHEGKGQTLGLLVGAQVFGIFLDGQNSQLPLIVGSIPKERDTQVKSNKNYPHNKVYDTISGHFKEYDDTPEKERIKEQHQSGTHWEITNDTFTIAHKSGSSITMDEKGNIKIEVGSSKDSGGLSIPGKITLIGESIKLNS